MPTRQKTSQAKDAPARALEVVRRLAAEYPDAKCALHFGNPLELLIATILSAQCTDERVNIVTRDLFKKYRSAKDYASADANQLEQDIRTTGFFRNKAKSIRGCCRLLLERHQGELPSRLEELVELPGIGRKTANVVLGTAMGLATGVVVDTHVHRVSRRLGLTRQNDPVKIEQVLMRLIPQQEWINFAHRMIWHGRRVCTARNPACERCCLNDICPKVGVARKKPKVPSSQGSHDSHWTRDPKAPG
jgi:endonuclease-3